MAPLKIDRSKLKKLNTTDEEVETTPKREETTAPQQDAPVMPVPPPPKTKPFWQKYPKVVYGTMAAVVVLLIGAWWFSDERRYSKGEAAFENGDYGEAIEILNKIGSGYDKYPTAQWMLYQAYVNQRDSASAATALEHATESGQWSRQPEAAREYCKHLTMGTFMPYLKNDHLKAASLMETVSEGSHSGIFAVSAAEIYFNSKDYDKAYSIFSRYESLRGTTSASQIANGYMGLYYLYGLSQVDRDINKAKKYLEYAAYKEEFVSHRILLELALMSHPDYDLLRDLVNRSTPETWYPHTELKIFHDVGTKLVEAYDRHVTDDFVKSWTSSWNEYSYDSGRGSYEGEFEGNVVFGGNACGWGIFTHRGTDYNTVNLGKHYKQGNDCPLSGTGVVTNYYPQSGKIIVSAGTYSHDGVLTDDKTWSNDDISNIQCSVQFPF